MLTVNCAGVTLPVIDLRRPEFQERDDETAIAALRRAYEEEERRRRRMPHFILKFMFMLASRKAPLLRALTNPSRNYLDGLSTYVMKLRPEQLPPPFDNKIDRKIVGSPLVISVRLRMQQLAHIVAEALERELETSESSGLHLINIGGGPAMDSINALLLLGETGKLVGRTVSIHVLDREPEGANFGACALKALVKSGAFASTKITLNHRPYDWTSPEELAKFAVGLARDGSIVVAMSEGALFEYASDDSIRSNLAALHDSQARFVAGSVTRSDELTRRALKQTRLRLYPRGAAGLGVLAASTGYHVAEVRSTLTGDQVLLLPHRRMEPAKGKMT